LLISLSIGVRYNIDLTNNAATPTNCSFERRTCFS
jgi:hypothetical protein